MPKKSHVNILYSELHKTIIEIDGCNQQDVELLKVDDALAFSHKFFLSIAILNMKSPKGLLVDIPSSSL